MTSLDRCFPLKTISSNGSSPYNSAMTEELEQHTKTSATVDLFLGCKNIKFQLKDSNIY